MKRRQTVNVGLLYRQRILDVLENANRPMSISEIADTVTLSIPVCQAQVEYMQTKDMCHVHSRKRGGKPTTFRAGKKPLLYVRDPILSALTMGAL